MLLGVIMVLGLLPAVAFAENEYTITYNQAGDGNSYCQVYINGYSHQALNNGDSCTVAAGTEVTVTGHRDGNTLLEGWDVEPSNLDSDIKNQSITFTMPEQNVTLTMNVRTLNPQASFNEEGVLTWNAVEGYKCGFEIVPIDETGNPEFVIHSATAQDGKYSYDIRNELQNQNAEANTYIAVIFYYDGDNMYYSSKAIIENAATYYYSPDKQYTLTTPTNLRWNGYVAEWDAVTHAGSYEVKITCTPPSGNEKTYTETVNTTQLNLSDSDSLTLENGATYKFAVTALPDVSSTDYAKSAQSSYSSSITYKEVISYGVTVAGVDVTSENADDVLNNGTVKYSPDTNALHLTNATINGVDDVAISADGNLWIQLEGNNTCIGSIQTGGDLKINGLGTVLDVGSFDDFDATLTVTTTKNNHRCIDSNGSIEVYGAALKLTATDPLTKATSCGEGTHFTISGSYVDATGPRSGISCDHGTIKITNSTVIAEGTYGIDANSGGSIEISGSTVSLNGTDAFGAYANTMTVEDSDVSVSTDSYTCNSMYILITLTIKNSAFTSQSPNYGLCAGNIVVDDSAGATPTELKVVCDKGASIHINGGQFTVTPANGVIMDAFEGTAQDGSDAERVKGAPFSEMTVLDNYYNGNYFQLKAHEHEAGAEWKSDGTNHWNLCVCGEKMNVAACSGGTATCTSPATCDICGNAYGSTDPDNHVGEIVWTPSDTGHTGTYSCCNATVPEENHAFTWITDKEATATEAGSKHEECTICGYAKASVEIPATGVEEDPSNPSQPGETPGDSTQPGETPEDSSSNTNDSTDNKQTDAKAIPQTGESGNTATLAAAALVIGTILIGFGLWNRKKSYSK